MTRCLSDYSVCDPPNSEILKGAIKYASLTLTLLLICTSKNLGIYLRGSVDLMNSQALEINKSQKLFSLLNMHGAVIVMPSL